MRFTISKAARALVPATLTYAAMILGAAALFLLFRSWGEGLTPRLPPAPVGGAVGAAASDVLWHVLLALAAVVVAGRSLGVVFKSIGQPPVIGEVVAGILLGPSLLGRVSPAVSQYVLPPDIAPFIGVIAQIGVIVYMFIVGLELNPDILRGQVQATVATSHASIVVPFVLGSGLALYLYPGYSPANVTFTNFALFLGVAMSITAFPVLARILADTGMTRTKLGVLALTCAAVDDVTAWCLLAFVVAVVQATGTSAIVVSLLTAAFIALIFLVVRPVFHGLARSAGEAPAQGVIALALVSMLLAALTTEAIGVHAIFGAFLLGAVIPHDSGLARSLRHGLGDLVTILFLPAFFAFTGMRTQIGLVETATEWWTCGLIVAVATVGKFGGAAVAARVAGLDWRHAAGLGMLMNTRGLMELIVLNVGLDLGVISPTLFTMMVLMALTTTLATTPSVRLLGLFNEPATAPQRAPSRWVRT